MPLLLEGARDDDGHIRGSRRRGHPWNPTQAAGGPLDRARGDLFLRFELNTLFWQFNYLLRWS